ncbi:MAG: oligosaccharide flippase family protein [Flavobacteriaceae bacterium]|nr:MAG: oligosaccharide flippase family protein [Flavobacteriaceae bacterium]
MFRGTAIGQIIAVLGSLYLAKLYGTDAYGVFGVFVSIISIFSIISTLQLEKNIVIAKNLLSAKNWYHFLGIVVLLVSVLLVAGIYFLSEQHILKNITPHLIICVFLGGILFSFFTVNESFFIFKKKFKLLSNSKILLTLINVSFQIILYSRYEIYGLIYGYIISQFLIVIFFYFQNLKFPAHIYFHSIKNELKSNPTIIKYLLPGNTINAFAIHLMPVLIVTFFDKAQAGVYFFTMKLLTAPLFLISSSVSQVYFQKISELYLSKRSEILKITKKLVRGNLLLMFFILLLINTLGIYLLELYLHRDWQHISMFTLGLSFLIFARTSFNPVSSLIVVLNKNHISLLFNSYLLSVNLIAVYVGHLQNTITVTIVILSVFGGIGYFLLLLYFLNVLKKLKNV